MLANAFFVASEFALVKMRRTRLEELTSEGHVRAAVALGISRKLDAYLSANQLGITLASLALGWLAEPALASFIVPLLSSSAGISSSDAHAVALVVSLGIVTFAHTVLGELVPKSLAIQHTETVALWTAAPLRAFYWAAFPVIWVLNGASRLVVRMLGLRSISEVELLHSPAELRLLLSRVALEPETRELIDRLFDYNNHVAERVMTPRRQTITLDASTPWDQVARTVLAEKYTRYPVVDAADRVIGYVHVKDLFTGSTDHSRRSTKEDVAEHRTPAKTPEPLQERPTLSSLLREPLRVTPETPLDRLLHEFLSERAHLAVVHDGTGAFVGIVTLEDVLEEFVGEIRDEHDTHEAPRTGRDR